MTATSCLEVGSLNDLPGAEKPLAERSLEELWQLFPILIRAYNPLYPMWFHEQKERILRMAGSDAERISHIGSTAVPGLLSKPTVDILFETRPGAGWDSLVRALTAGGWILMSRRDSPPALVFNQGYTPSGFAERVFHLHLRELGDWDELYFRDYLLAHPEAAEKYGKLKLRLAKRFRNDRDGYTGAKTEFIRTHTALARREFPDKYKTK